MKRENLQNISYFDMFAFLAVIFCGALAFAKGDYTALVAWFIATLRHMQVLIIKYDLE